MKSVTADASYISTGRAAELLFVTRDTVLKWVKQGKLPTKKTAGGHYRISRRSVESLLPVIEDSLDKAAQSAGKQSVPCWEYNAQAGKIKESCRSCLVFKARGERCYEVGKILKQKGVGGTCCPTSCEECSYYREQKRASINILVFSDNENLKESLIRESAFSRLDLIEARTTE